MYEIKVDTKLEVSALQKEADTIWAELHGTEKNPIVVKRLAAGLTGAEVLILFGPLAVQVASDLWAHIFLPRLKQKFGADAVKLPPKT